MFISPAYAQGAAASQVNGTAASMQFFAPLVLVFIVFYFLMLRPQQRRVKALQSAIGGLKKGDSVVTAGGLIGKVTKVEDTVVELELGPNTRVRVVRATIAEVTPLGSKPAND